MGALTAALTAIFNAHNYTSSTSGIASKKIPVTESNGLPSGQIGMSDLASVLGASIGAIDDVLNINIGVSTISSTTANRPFNSYFFALTFGTSTVKIVLAVQTNGDLAYLGCVRDGTVTWKRITLT